MFISYKLAKNKKAARDSRYRKKLYIDLLEKKLELQN